LTEYKIIRWDENSFDINSNPFTKEAYRLKKYAFVAWMILGIIFILYVIVDFS